MSRSEIAERINSKISEFLKPFSMIETLSLRSEMVDEFKDEFTSELANEVFLMMGKGK